MLWRLYIFLSHITQKWTKKQNDDKGEAGERYSKLFYPTVRILVTITSVPGLLLHDVCTRFKLDIEIVLKLKQQESYKKPASLDHNKKTTASICISFSQWELAIIIIVQR